VRWWCRRRDERGAIIPVVGLLLVVLVPSSAMAVDLGMQRVVRRDMQTLADVVSLDVVRLVDGRTASQIRGGYNDLPTLDLAVTRSVARNDDDVLGDAPVVTAMLVHLDTATGELDRVSGGAVREVTGPEVPNAVMVTAMGSVDFAFLPGRGPAMRTAVAIASPSACFRLGSYAVGVSSSDSALLNSVLPALLDNTTFSSTLVGYQGLAAADLDLLDLVGVTGLGVGTPDELLDLDGLTLGQFYAAMASALQAQGGHTAEVTLLQTLSANANVTGTIGIRDLLDIASGDSAALAASFNVLDLVVGAAYAANGSHAFAVPGLAAQVPGLGGLYTQLTVVEPPQLACGEKGKATAQTGQVDLVVRGSIPNATRTVSGLTTALGPLGAVVGGVLSGITNGVVSGALLVKDNLESEMLLAQAKGALTDIVCGDATASTNAEGIDVGVSAALASSMSAKETVAISGTLNLKITTLLGVSVNIATISVDLSSTASVSTSQGTSSGTVSFRHPPDAFGTPKSYGSGIVLNNLTAPTVNPAATVHITFVPGYGTSGDVAISSVSGLAGVLNSALSTATATANSSLVSPLNTTVAAQLAKQLGINVGGADVFALPRPSCNDPGLAG
jgi:uncharacterized membrane protein